MSRAMICTMACNGRVRLVFFKLRLDRLLVVMTMVPSRISAWLVLLPRERMRSRVMCSVCHVCVCMYVCMYIYVDKKRTVWGLTTGKSPVSVIYCSLVEFNGQKRGLLCQAIRPGNGTILLTGRKKGPGKLYYGKPRLVYLLCNAAQSVLTVLRAHTNSVQCCTLHHFELCTGLIKGGDFSIVTKLSSPLIKIMNCGSPCTLYVAASACRCALWGQLQL